MLSKGVRPQNPAQHLRGSSRRCSGAGQDRGVQAIMPRQETCRDAVCAFEAYPTARPAAIARAMRCPVRVHVGSDCAEPSQACQVGRPATTTRPCVLCVTLQASVKSSVSRPAQSSGWQRTASTNGISRPVPSVCRLLQQNPPRAVIRQLIGLRPRTCRSRLALNCAGLSAVLNSLLQPRQDNCRPLRLWAMGMRSGCR